MVGHLIDDPDFQHVVEQLFEKHSLLSPLELGFGPLPMVALCRGNAFSASPLLYGCTVTWMASAFFSDPSAPTGSRFKCSACGCEQCSRVTVRKASGASYSTEFVSCAMCRVLYHWPGEVPRAPATLRSNDGQASGD
jgi:hypothetical protein